MCVVGGGREGLEGLAGLGTVRIQYRQGKGYVGWVCSKNAKMPKKCDRQQRKGKNLGGEVVLEKGERKEGEGTQAFAGGRL